MIPVSAGVFMLVSAIDAGCSIILLVEISASDVSIVLLAPLLIFCLSDSDFDRSLASVGG